jgi:hypothetical protein
MLNPIRRVSAALELAAAVRVPQRQWQRLPEFHLPVRDPAIASCGRAIVADGTVAATRMCRSARLVRPRTRRIQAAPTLVLLMPS